MKIAFSIAASLALAACGRPNPIANHAQNTDAPAPVATNTAGATHAPPANGAVTPGVQAATGPTLPAALQGRWGLTPGDCTSTRGDAKGLLVIGPTELKFYESRAVPSQGIETSPHSASGNFSFTGEGQSWSKYEALHLSGGKLVRTEQEPTASFTYARC